MDEPRTGASSHFQLACLHLQQAFAEAFSFGYGRASAEDAAALEERLSRAAAEPPAAGTPPGTPPNARVKAGDASSPSVAYDLTRELDTVSPQGTCIVDPTGGWKGRWDVVIMMLILYSAGSVPVRLGFNAEAEGYVWILEAGMSILFIFDLTLSFRTAYTGDDAKWETGSCNIAMRYLSGWFWIDAPSSVPVELIELWLEQSGAENASPRSLSLLRILRMFRLVRLLRLLKVGEYVTTLEEAFDINLRPLRILQLVMKMAFIAHLLACCWFWVGTHPSSPEEATWVSTYDGGAALEGEVSEQYLFAIYWALTTLTTVGYGDITPTNDFERTFVTCSLLIGSLVFAYILGDVASLFATLDRQSAMVGEKMDSVKEYLLWREIPRGLGVRVRRYYEHYYKSRPVFDEATILAELNPTLHSEMVQHILSTTLGKLPLFRDGRCDPDFFEQMFGFVKPTQFDPSEVRIGRPAPQASHAARP